MSFPISRAIKIDFLLACAAQLFFLYYAELLSWQLQLFPVFFVLIRLTSFTKFGFNVFYARFFFVLAVAVQCYRIESAYGSSIVSRILGRNTFHFSILEDDPKGITTRLLKEALSNSWKALKNGKEAAPNFFLQYKKLTEQDKIEVAKKYQPDIIVAGSIRWLRVSFNNKKLQQFAAINIPPFSELKLINYIPEIGFNINSQAACMRYLSSLVKGLLTRGSTENKLLNFQRASLDTGRWNSKSHLAYADMLIANLHFFSAIKQQESQITNINYSKITCAKKFFERAIKKLNPKDNLYLHYVLTHNYAILQKVWGFLVADTRLEKNGVKYLKKVAGAKKTPSEVKLIAKENLQNLRKR